MRETLYIALPCPPVGIAYLASTLEKHGFNIKAIDMFDYYWDKVRQTLEKEQPDVVGITCLTEQRASPLKVAKLSKTINKDCTVIMGRIHPTIMCEQVLEYLPVDIIVLGEGEEPIKELMICLEEKKVIGDVQGIAYKYQGKIIRTPPRQLIHNLDDISFPAYKYFDFADDIFTVNKNRVIDLCKEIIDRKLDIVWDCETRVNFIWEDMLEWMTKSGCYCISFGVESASETVLKAIKKRPRRNKLNTPLNSQNRWA